MALSPEKIQQLRAQYGIPAQGYAVNNASGTPQIQNPVKSAEERIRELWPEPTAPRAPRLGDGAAGEFGAGVIGSLIKTGSTIEKGLDQTLGRGINILQGRGNVPTNTGNEARAFADKVTDQSGASKAGEFVGTAAQYLAGPSGVAKAPVAAGAKLLPKVGGFIARQAPEAVKDVAIGTLNTGDPVEGAIQGATALIPVGAAKGLAGKAVGYVEDSAKRTDDFIRKLVTPEQTKGKTGVFTQNIGAGRVSEGGGVFKGRDVAPDARQIAIETEVKTVPGVSPKNTKLDNSNAIYSEIGNTAHKLESDLINRDVQAVLTKDLWDGYMAVAESESAYNPLLVGDAAKTAGKILSKFKELLPTDRDITAIDILKARKELDAWMRSLKGDAFDPKTENAVSIALRAVRQGANDLVEQTAEDVAVRDMLRRQSLLYDAVENIAPKAAKEGDSAFARLLNDYPFIKWIAPVAATSILGGGIGAGLVGRGAGGSG